MIRREIERESQAKCIDANVSEQEMLSLALPLPDGAWLRVEQMSVEDFIDACEMCLVGLAQVRQEVCRQLLYEGRLPFRDEYAAKYGLNLEDTLHRWYVLEELTRMGVKLPEQEVA